MSHQFNHSFATGLVALQSQLLRYLFNGKGFVQIVALEPKHTIRAEIKISQDHIIFMENRRKTAHCDALRSLQSHDAFAGDFSLTLFFSCRLSVMTRYLLTSQPESASIIDSHLFKI